MTVPTMRLDAYVVDTLLPDLVGHDRRPSAFLVYLVLWRTSGAGKHEAQIPLRQLAESTGLSKRAVQEALELLVRRRLVHAEHESISAVPSYRVLRPWAKRR